MTENRELKIYRYFSSKLINKGWTNVLLMVEKEDRCGIKTMSGLGKYSIGC